MHGSKGQRQFSWAPAVGSPLPPARAAWIAPTRTLTKAERVAADRHNASSLFIAQHPGLHLHDFLGVPPAGVLAAYRRRARELHPDRWSSSSLAVQKQKEEEFKMLGTVKEILIDPVMATPYTHWKYMMRPLRPARARSRRDAGPAHHWPPPAFSLSARSSRRLRPHRDMGKPRVTTSDKNSGRLVLRQTNHAGSWLQSAMTLGQIYLKQIYASSHPILWVDDPYYDMVCLQN